MSQVPSLTFFHLWTQTWQSMSSSRQETRENILAMGQSQNLKIEREPYLVLLMTHSKMCSNGHRFREKSNSPVWDQLEQPFRVYAYVLHCDSFLMTNTFKQHNMKLTQKRSKRDKKEYLIPPRMSNTWGPITKPRYQTTNRQQVIKEVNEKKKKFGASAHLPRWRRLNKPPVARREGSL